MTKKVLLLICFGIFFGNFAQAQTKKLHQDPYIWTDLQLDYYLPNQDFFFFRNQYRHNTDSDFAALKESGALSKFYQIYVLAGYEHKFTEHWRAAVSARYTFDPNIDNKIFQATLRHNGKIGNVDFLKRLAFDYIKPEFGDSRGRIRPAVAIEKNFTLGKHTLRPSLSYELFFYTDFKDQNPTVETRNVDRTRLRAAISYKAMSFLWLTPYFMKQTEYFNVISTFSPLRDANGVEILDADGNQILIENKGGKRNRIEPIIGLDIRFIIPGRNMNDETVPGHSLNDNAGN